jgi:DNA-binding MarR family transcriptional regulator
MDTHESLLRAILATVARKTFSPAELYKIVAPTSRSEKQIAAYKLCDGNTSQAEISRKSKVDRSDLSKMINRWVNAGIVVRLGQDEYPLHVYPFTDEVSKSPNTER